VDHRSLADITIRGANAIRVELVDGRTLECEPGDLEPTEHGLLVDRLFLPWDRVARYAWALAPRDFAPETSGSVRVHVRLKLVDGDEHLVPADRFETGPWFVSAILDDVVDTESVSVLRSKHFFPWHSVDEYERVPIDEGDAERRPST
jgi:hypothetical protein